MDGANISVIRLHHETRNLCDMVRAGEGGVHMAQFSSVTHYLLHRLNGRVAKRTNEMRNVMKS
jgi:hypothetical protein